MTAADNTVSEQSPRFNRAAQWTLVFIVGLLALNVTQVVYRFFLPTDGWGTTFVNLDSAALLYYQNLVGLPSELQPQDVVTGMEGRPLETFTPGAYPDFWQAGATVEYSVVRESEELRLPVTIGHWTLLALVRHVFLTAAILPSVAGTLLLLSVALLAFVRCPADPAARMLLVFAGALSAPVISGLLPVDYAVIFNRAIYILMSFFSFMVYGILLAPALLSFTLLFPRPKPAIVRRPWLAYTPFGVGLLVAFALLSGGSAYFGWVPTMLMLLASLASLGHSVLTMRDAVSRAQLLWAVGGFVVGIGLFLLNFPSAFGWLPDSLAYWAAALAGLGGPVMGIGLAIAVLRYRLFDIEVIIRRTTAYAILTALLALIYFGSVVLLQRLFGQVTGEQSTAAVVLSTLLIAVLFLPLRRRVQAIIDRRFFRQKYDAEKTLEAFAATVRNEPDLDALTTELVRVIQETMQPEHVAVWLRPVERDSAQPAGRSESRMSPTTAE